MHRESFGGQSSGWHFHLFDDVEGRLQSRHRPLRLRLQRRVPVHPKHGAIPHFAEQGPIRHRSREETKIVAFDGQPDLVFGEVT